MDFWKLCFTLIGEERNWSYLDFISTMDNHNSGDEYHKYLYTAWSYQHQKQKENYFMGPAYPQSNRP